MNTAIQNFDANMQRVRELGGLYNALESLTTSVIDKSDILRSQLVLGVSALDFYVHEIVYLGMLEIVDGIRQSTPAYDNYKISMRSFTAVLPFREVFANEVREKHSYLAFQQPDKIADAIRLVSTIVLWEEVATVTGKTARDLKEQLRLIVDRRNKIAHEADIDPSYPGARWPITESDVNDALVFIESVVRAIDVRLGVA
jgi:hypothetical protein